MGYGYYICDEGLHFHVGNKVITNPKPHAKMAAPVKYELAVVTREIVPTMMLLPQEQRAHHPQAHGMLLQLQQQSHK